MPFWRCRSRSNGRHDALGFFASARADGRGSSEAPAPQRSADINTEAEAEAYWLKRFGGKVYPVWRNGVTATFHFARTNDHGYTNKHRPSGHRLFDQDRARNLDRIIPAMMEGQIWGHGADDIYVATTNDSRPYVCVFGWDPSMRRYSFRTAYPFDKAAAWAERREALAMTRKKPKGESAPMAKAMGSNTMLQVFNISPGASQLPPERTSFPVMAVAEIELDHWTYLCEAIPPGARWITVRPSGPGTPSRPLLIQPNADGSSRVIGGAGGKPNDLKLKGVRSEGEYAARTKEHATVRREQQREQTNI